MILATTGVDLVLKNSCLDSIWLVQTTFSNPPDFITSPSVDDVTHTTIKRLNIAFYLAEFWDRFLTVGGILSNVEDFGTSIYGQSDIHIFQTVLESMLRSLKSLNLVFWGRTFENLIRSLDMHILRNLRDVTFCLVLGNESLPTSAANLNPCRWFTFLNDINIPAQILDIKVLVQICLTRDEVLGFEALAAFHAERGSVELSIFNGEKFPMMKRILLYVNIAIREVPGQNMTTFNDEETQSNIEARMMSLLIPPEAGRINAMVICNLI